MPDLFNAISHRPRNQTVWEALDNRQGVRDITGAPTAVVLVEYVQLWDTLGTFHLLPGTPDRFIWRWTADSA